MSRSDAPYGAAYEAGRKRHEDRIAADPAALEPRLEIAQLAYVAGDFKTAEEHLNEAAQIAPDNPRVHLRIGDVLYETDRHDAALESYERAEELAAGGELEDEAKLERELAERDASLVHLPLAEAEKAVAGRAPATAELNGLGGLYLLSGSIEDAGEQYRRAVELDESSVQAALNLGFIQGLAVVEPSKLKRSVKELTAAAERFADEPRIQLHLAELYETSSLYDAAIQRIMRALLNSKTCMESYDLAARYVLLGGGREVPLEKRIEEIVAEAETELEASPDDDSKKRMLAIALLGRLRYQRVSSSGDKDLGREDLERASRLLEEVKDADEEGLVRLAECRERLGAVDDAESLLRDATVRSPGSYRPLFELAALKLRMGEPDDAVELFVKAVEVAPEEATIYQSLRFALSSSRKLRLAELTARKQLEANPKNVDAYLKLGNAYLDALRKNAAIEALRKAAELAPTRADVHVALGRALAKLEKVDEAETSFQNAISIDPTLADAYKGLGNLLVDRPGRMTEGLQALDQYRRLRSGKD